MSKTASKPTAPSPAAKSPLPIDGQIVDLRRRRAGIVEEIVALEAQGAVPQEEERAAKIEQQALALLDDREAKVVAVPVRPSANARLLALRDLLRAYDRALDIAAQRRAADHGARSRELIAEHAGQWAELQRHRAELVIGLLKANREIETLRKTMSSGGQFAGVALDNFTPRLFGVGGAQTPVNHWAFEFLKAAAKSGLIDPQAFKNV